MSDMGVHDGHRERMRKMYLEAGPAAMTDVNLLEMLLFYAIQRKDTNELAHNLLAHFGTLSDVLAAEPGELASVPGIGENTAVLIRLVSDIRARGDAAKARKTRFINNSTEAGQYFIALLSNENREKALLASLDSRNRVLHVDELGTGSVNAVGVDIRLVAEAAIRSKATSVIFAHNHPDGECFPSNEDISLTDGINSALGGIGIVLADHIIVADDQYYSFADHGRV